ncbi:hypothetical protein, partial [Acinetobacter baumannii]|uniref:hypothetical protein n=1 Tax=Acinetobacter baumannii TaxID=470 RepID=UPI001C0786E1
LCCELNHDIEILDVNVELNHDIEILDVNVHRQIIWNNSHIKIANKTYYFRKWHKKGILQIADLMDKNGFLEYNRFIDIYNIQTDIMTYNSVIDSIP